MTCTRPVLPLFSLFFQVLHKKRSTLINKPFINNLLNKKQIFSYFKKYIEILLLLILLGCKHKDKYIELKTRFFSLKTLFKLVKIQIGHRLERQYLLC